MKTVMEIGQKVRNSYGETGTIVDRMYSTREDKYFYSVKLDSRDEEVLYSSENLQKVEELPMDNFEFEVEILDGVVVCKVFKTDSTYRVLGGKKKEISRGHGHIIHEGDIGIMQAFSYAAKKAYEKLNNGNL
jgi:hypothetical protein